MKATKDLFNLIKSLSKTEKSYFKKFAVRHNDENNNAFLRLFDAFDRKKETYEYTEDDIKERFKNERFVKQLPVIKNYLYSTILKSLNLYYMEEKTDIRLNNVINSANILFQKELLGQSLKMLEKARKIALENELDVKLLEVIQLERKVLRINQSLNQVTDELNRSYEEEEELLRKLENIRRYRKLYDRFIIFASGYGVTKNKETQQELIDILNDPLLQDYSNAKYTQTQILYHSMRSLISRFLSDTEAATRHVLEVLKIIDSTENGKQKFLADYLQSKQNLISQSVGLSNFAQADAVSEELLAEQNELVKDQPLKVKNFLLSRTYIIIACYNMYKGEFEQNIPIIRDVTLLTENNRFRDEEIVSNYVAAVNYFALGDFQKSLETLNKIFNSRDFPLRKDIQSSSRVFNLILHYELGNTESLEYFIKSTYRYLRKNKNLLKLEMLILKFIKDLVKVQSQKHLKELLMEKKAELEGIFTDPAESEQMHGFELIAWIESKIEDKSYAEVVKSKFMRQVARSA
jgi:hypothetical protein